MTFRAHRSSTLPPAIHAAPGRLRNILLADEISRAPKPNKQARSHARAATIDGERHVLPDPFMVLATQNPIEYEGTYPLPEAQLDRFMFKVLVGYPSEEAEQEVLRRYHTGFDAQHFEATGIQPVIASAHLPAIREEIQQVKVEEGFLATSPAYYCQPPQPRPDPGWQSRAKHHLTAHQVVAALQGRVRHPGDVGRHLAHIATVSSCAETNRRVGCRRSSAESGKCECRGNQATAIYRAWCS